MAIPLIPWEPHVFPDQIQAELRRRSINRGMRPVNSSQVSWVSDTDEWNNYRGPMVSWVRVCSNGYGTEENRMPGFVLYGGKDFATSYGFNNALTIPTSEFKGPNQTVLGFMPDGTAHVLENDINASPYPVHVPNPEIEKVSANIQKELLRRVRIEWTCFSFKQLEYMTPYFLVPGISVIVEWGWNHFNPESLLDLKDTNRLAEYFNNPYPLYTKNVMDSRGNYEVVFGIITNFEWSIDGNKIKCVTEITSKDRLWAGQAVNSTMIEADSSLSDNDQTTPSGTPKSDTNSNLNVIDSLKKFTEQYIDKLKDLIVPDKDADAILGLYTSQTRDDPLSGLVRYVMDMHPENYKEYLFGLYYGRDEKTVTRTSTILAATAAAKVGGMVADPVKTIVSSVDDYANKEFDFDCQSQRSSFWINMGLVIEIINFSSFRLMGVKNQPMFRIDVDDCVISGHPNLISTNGDILLIPNALAPKYHSGLYGAVAEKNNPDYEKMMKPASIVSPTVHATELNPNDLKSSLKWANYRLRKILLPYEIRRDDISGIINANRFKYAHSQGDYEFPFSGDLYEPEGDDLRKYDAYYTGYFKNLYLNVEVLKKIMKDNSVVYFSDVIKQLFIAINSAAGEFWKFKLDGSTGRFNTTGIATMKVVDENMTQYTSNVGKVFTFDYNAADGLLHAINFRPTLSNAQAIRTIYAQTNLTNKKKVVLSGHNELLDYKFRDRLFMIGDQSGNKGDTQTFKESSFKASMGKLQSVRPPDKSFQVTSKNSKGEKTIYRLAIPPGHEEVLSLILDDNDKGHNPQYTGIMPGIQADFTIQGIAGIRTFAMFRVRGLPEPYSERNIVFRVINCTDTIQNGQWVTQIVAGVIPLRGYFASKLGLTVKDVEPVK